MASPTAPGHWGFASHPALLWLAVQAVAVGCQDVPLDAGRHGLPKRSLQRCLSLFVPPTPDNQIELKGVGVLPNTLAGEAVPKDSQFTQLIIVAGSHLPGFALGDLCDRHGAAAINLGAEGKVITRVLTPERENTVLALDPGPYAIAVVNCGNVSGISPVGSLRYRSAMKGTFERYSPLDGPRLPVYAALTVAWIVTAVAFCGETRMHGRSWTAVQHAAALLLIPAIVECVVTAGSVAVVASGDSLRRAASIAACWKMTCFWHAMLVDPITPSERWSLPLQLLCSVYLIAGTTCRTLLDTSRRYGGTRREIQIIGLAAHTLELAMFIIAFVKLNRYVSALDGTRESAKARMYRQLRGLSVVAFLGMLASRAAELLDTSLQSPSTWGIHCVYADAIPQGTFLLCAMLMLALCSADADVKQQAQYDQLDPGSAEEAGVIGKPCHQNIWDEDSSDEEASGAASPDLEGTAACDSEAGGAADADPVGTATEGRRWRTKR